MREIKFRTWQGGRFHYWGFIKSKYGDDYEFHAIADTNAEPLSMTEKMARSQQYTGLHDKQGKEIYEGDIVRVPETPVTFEEIYRKDAFILLLTPYGIRHSLQKRNRFVEVIGNIYEA